jgi:MoaA/NifB/PqqE/SkfB family radical SAM enzyme
MSSSSPSNVQRVAPTHDFAAKLKQPSLFPHVLDYVRWQREVRAAREAGKELPSMPELAPISINLDLTTACNYRCDHCIDWDILNSPIKYEHEKLEQSIGEMAARGLKSVILIGGGEPTIYPGFERMVRYLKELKLQVAIVSNGSRNDKLLEIMDVLTEGDWVRLSLDSGTDETFQKMHKPVKPITLDEICEWIPKLRERNPAPLVGFSYIIVWGGAEREEGVEIVPNIEEIVTATKRARDYQFSYISLKPFLTRAEGGSEVMNPEQAQEELDAVIARIRELVNEAKQYESPDFRVTESINLRVLEQGNWKDFTHQPQMCHMQALRQVLSPMGLYNCPAHRGVEKAQIGGRDAYAGSDAFRVSAQSTANILDRFDASHECKEVTCLYHSVNWWLEDLVKSGVDLDALENATERMDWFL